MSTTGTITETNNIGPAAHLAEIGRRVCIPKFQVTSNMLSSIYLPGTQPANLAPLPADAIAAIGELRDNWHRLHDLDRASAVRDVVQLGVSRRRLAEELGVDEKLIRRLLKTLDASGADQDLSRRNLVSTNELVRRAKGRSASAEQRAADTKAIVDWLRADRLRESRARLILHLSYRMVKIVERNYDLPPACPPLAAALNEAIEGCRPDPSGFSDPVHWSVTWLSTWVLHLIPGADRRMVALSKALEHFSNASGSSELW